MFKNFSFAIADTLTIVRRNLIRYVRSPRLVVFSTIQPVMFVLLFVFVFGGAINTHGTEYVKYLIPGILVQTVIFGAMNTGIGLADDMTKGMIDRFKSLPMARSAVLTGRTIADIIRNIFVILLMVGVGHLIGFRFENGAANAVAAIGVLVFFGFAFSWVSATIGLSVDDAETAQISGMIWVFPLVFASSIFVPTDTMPHWLEAFAKVSPITMTANAVRTLSLGGDAWHWAWRSLAWSAGILAVFSPLAVRQYRRK